MLKIKGTEIQQALTELMMQAAGPLAQAFRPVDADATSTTSPRALAPRYCNIRKATIYAGSNEIQRNIIAKATLGLRRRDELRAQRRAAAPRRQPQALRRQRLHLRRARARSWPRRRAAARTCGRRSPRWACSALPFAAEHGGFGGSAVDVMVVMEAIGEGAGRRALPAPPWAWAASFVARGGTEAQQKRILPALIQGKHRAGLRPHRARRALRPAPRRARGRDASGRRLHARRREARGAARRLRRHAGRLGAHRGRRHRRRAASACSSSTAGAPGVTVQGVPHASTSCARPTSGSPA